MKAETDGLTWNGREWVVGVSIPFFRGVGGEFLNPRRDEVLRPWGGFTTNDEALAAYPPEPASEDPLEEDVLFRDARFLLRYEVGNRKRSVRREQKAAWQLIAERGDAVWEEAMALVLKDYQIQRPTRVKWWKATFGNLPFDRELPEISNEDELRKYCRPYSIKVHALTAKAKRAEVSVHFMCTWIAEGFSVRISEGRAISIKSTRGGWLPGNTLEFEHSIVGRLTAFRSGDCWSGQCSCDSLLAYQHIIPQRVNFAQEGVDRERPRSLMRWDFAHGRFGFYVYVDPPGSEPCKEQVEAWRAFGANEPRNADILIDAIFSRAQQRYEENRRNYMGKYLDAAVPVLRDRSRFYEMMELANVYVHPPDGAGSVLIVFEFHCSFEISTIILFRNGSIERFGEWRDHAPLKN